MGTYHICFRTRLAPRLKPCAETAKLSIERVSLSPELDLYRAPARPEGGKEHENLKTNQSCLAERLAFLLVRPPW